MGTPLNRRAYNVFLSHSSQDKIAFVDDLYQWLTRRAGLKIWYDRNLASGQVAANLDQAINDSKAAVVVISERSVQSHWVGLECSRLQEEAARTRGDFRIATIRLDGADPPGLLKAFKHIDIANSTLTAGSAALLMDSLFGGKDSADGRSVYLSRGWREAERGSAERIGEALQAHGLRLVCDWTDQPHYDENRVREIMEGTGGFAAILPHRGNGETSSYMIREIAMARMVGIPILVFSHRDITPRPEWSLPDALPFDNGIEHLPIDEIVTLYGSRIEEFTQSWHNAMHGDHVFLGHSLEQSIDDKFLTARGMLSRITGLPIRVGGLVDGLEAQSEITRLIRESGLCIIDITNQTYENLPPRIDFALNSCIEAGVALGCGKPLYLTCRGPRRTPPFMFRNKQVWFYDNDLELIGNLCQIAEKHRRMVL